MLSRLLSTMEAGWWSQASTIIFFAIFIVITVWAYLPSRHDTMEQGRRLPFEY